MTVICTSCNEDWTGRTESGGIAIGCTEYCPECSPTLEADLWRFGQTSYIWAHCPDGKSFADWVVERTPYREAWIKEYWSEDLGGKLKGPELNTPLADGRRRM